MMYFALFAYFFVFFLFLGKKQRKWASYLGVIVLLLFVPRSKADVSIDSDFLDGRRPNPSTGLQSSKPNLFSIGHEVLNSEAKNGSSSWGKQREK